MSRWSSTTSRCGCASITVFPRMVSYNYNVFSAPVLSQSCNKFCQHLHAATYGDTFDGAWHTCETIVGLNMYQGGSATPCRAGCYDDRRREGLESACAVGEGVTLTTVWQERGSE